MKFIKTLICGAALLLATFTSQAQFRTTSQKTIDLLGGTNLLITTLGASNITVALPAGKDGFSVMPVMFGTNATTAALAIQAKPCEPNGTNLLTTTAVALGTVAQNGTTVVRGYVLVPPTTLANTAFILTLTNAHTATITVSNLFISFPQ